MKKGHVLIPILTFLSFCSCFSQLAMVRTTFTASYDSIYPAGGAFTSTAMGDEASQSGIPIGFTFNYLGLNYTTIGVNTNGVLGFAAMSASYSTGDLYLASGLNTIVCPWWSDMTILAGGGIRYQTLGVSPTRRFVAQWTRVTSSYAGSTQRLNFQVILYETSNVIEFKYGSVNAGTPNVNENGVIGIKNAIGGNGQYIDGITGSSFTGTFFNSAKQKWPHYHIRFTPGTSIALGGGSYNVGVGQTYATLQLAVADINHRGISGPIDFVLTDTLVSCDSAGGYNIFPVFIGPVNGSSASNTISIGPSSGVVHIIYDGSGNGGFANQTGYITSSSYEEPTIGLVGAEFVTIHDFNISSSGNYLDQGISVINSSSTLGSQHNEIRDVRIQLNRTNIYSFGIKQQLNPAPISASGVNSYNKYLNLDISNAYGGIQLNGNGTYPDEYCEIGNTNPNLFNTIGGATVHDIGGGVGGTAGIYMTNQLSVKCYNNVVRNVNVATTTAYVDGIYLTSGQGTCEIYNNKINAIGNTNYPGGYTATGIRASLVYSGTHEIHIYNNFVSDIYSANAIAPTTTMPVRGIWVKDANGGTGSQTYYIDNNNVSIDASATPNLSSVCVRVAQGSSTGGAVFKIRNNIFANHTVTQTSPARHMIFSTIYDSGLGGATSVSNYNDLYIANPVQGYIGGGFFGICATLNNWQTSFVQDLNSVSLDPIYTNTFNDLHVSNVALSSLGIPIPWINNDIDNESRIGNPDIGADEFAVGIVDVGADTLVSPANSLCYSTSQQAVVRIHNYSTDSINFFQNGVIVTLNISGAFSGTLIDTVYNNIYNGGIPLAPGNGMNVPLGPFDMSQPGTYTFNAYTAVLGDGNAINNSMPTISMIANGGSQSIYNIAVCSNSLPLIWGGNNYSTPGSYSDTLINFYGCDSVAILNLSINSNSSSISSMNVCSNELPFVWNGNSYSAAGSYSVSGLINVTGCDSTANLNLTINPINLTSIDATICSNNLPYIWNGINYYSTGYYQDTLINNLGCDSIVTLHIMVVSPLSSNSNIMVCNNHLPFLWNGNNYFSSGTYLVTLTGALGCDSIATLNLSVNLLSNSNTNLTICSSELPYDWNGNFISTTGIYYDTLVNSLGCDSNLTLNFTVNPVDTSISVSGYLLTSNQVGGNYQWVDCNNNYALILGATAPSYSVTASGSYGLMVSFNSCLDTSACYTFLNVGIDEHVSTSVVRISPNPTTSFVVLSANFEMKNANIILTNSSGQVVYNISSVNGMSWVIDVSEISSGMYFIHLYSEGKNYNLKLLKH